MDTIVWYASITWDYIVQMLPCAGAAAVGYFCLLPWRRRSLVRHELKSSVWREGALLLFILFCAGLAALTLFPSGFWSYLLFGCLLNGYPLHPLFELYIIQQGSFHWHVTVFQDLFGGPWTLYMLLGNIVMFAPLGFFPALLWDKPRWWKSTLIAAGASTCVEIVQLFIDRSSDINDLILNTLGGLAGYGLFRLLHCLAPRFAGKFKCVKVDSLYG